MTIRIWRWCIQLQRGGRATPWPWTAITISRRHPRTLTGEETTDA